MPQTFVMITDRVENKRASQARERSGEESNVRAKEERRKNGMLEKDRERKVKYKAQKAAT